MFAEIRLLVVMFPNYLLCNTMEIYLNNEIETKSVIRTKRQINLKQISDNYRNI